ncbi:helix-turn-helix transcriptional regulator [Neobacillus drentensis]|uniref:helix-turn-helix transcriptional regulator n=1 Tax=Neobacillus drentensis TaxID=220684 RepID=UPI0030005986
MNSNKLKMVRKEIGMSTSELARRSNLSRMTINNVEKGKSNPTASTIKLICDALNKNPTEIFFGEFVNRELQK